VKENLAVSKIKDDSSAFAHPAQNLGAGKSGLHLSDYRQQTAIQKKLADPGTKSSKEIPIQRMPNNTGLPANLKSGIETLSGYSMNDVKVHYNSSQPAQLNAHAYAQGTNIHVAPGQEKHLAHEAWHVVQQKQGRVKPTLQMKGKVNINDDKGLEKEADVMGAKALKTFQTKTYTSYKNGPQRYDHKTKAAYQLAKRNPGDLDYGFSGDRHVAMQDAVTKGDEARGTALPTVDHLNLESGVTAYMNHFMFHDLIARIKAYDVTSNKSLLGADLDPTNHKGEHTLLWIKFLKKNVGKIDLLKQVTGALGATPPGATMDHLNKNREKGVAPDKAVLSAWYNANTVPANATVKKTLSGWVWNAFFRQTSKLGIDFTAELGKAIHFNITADAYRKALARRGPLTAHGREAITYSELRHLKKLQDRGKAPKVYFQENTGVGVKDVASPFKTLDMLNATGIKKLLQTPQWKAAAVGYETRLGVYATKRGDAKTAVEESLTKMDTVLAKKHKSVGPGAYADHRKVFGQKKDSSAGQVGTDAATIRSVVKGIPVAGQDPINMREQMTAIYNASLWNSNGDTMKKILTEIGKITDDIERRDKAAAVGISEAHINELHTLILTQTKTTRDKLIDLMTQEGRIGRGTTIAKTLLNIDQTKAVALIAEIDKVRTDLNTYNGLPASRAAEKPALLKKMQKMLDKLAIDIGKKDINILATSVDTDTSRVARQTRGAVDNQANRKSAKDYADMGVPLSSREKASIGGVVDPLVKLPWEEGLAYFSIDESTGWGKEMKDAGIPTVAGNSGTAARLLAVYKWLGLSKTLAFRLGIMGWMLPSRDHSLYEIMNGAKSVGVTGAGEDITNPIKMYETIDPISKGDLESHVAVNGKFPDGVALEKVSDATYKDLIKQS